MYRSRRRALVGMESEKLDQWAPGENGVGNPAKNLIAAISRELVAASEDCGKIQVLISSLLDKTDHPDLVSEFHMIQDLDRMNQTLADLAVLTNSLTSIVATEEIDVETIAGGLKLTSLRDRLFPNASEPDDVASEHVTFF